MQEGKLLKLEMITTQIAYVELFVSGTTFIMPKLQFSPEEILHLLSLAFQSDTLKCYFQYDKDFELTEIVFKIYWVREMVTTSSVVNLRRPYSVIHGGTWPTFTIKVGEYKYPVHEGWNRLYDGGRTPPTLRSIASLVVDDYLSVLTLGQGYPLSIYVSGLLHHRQQSLDHLITHPASVAAVRLIERFERQWLLSLFSDDYWLWSMVVWWGWGLEDFVWLNEDEEVSDDEDDY